MKRAIVVFLFLLTFCQVLPAYSDHSMHLIVPQSGWYQGETLHIFISPIICNAIGSCMISGYGYENKMEQSVINFKGDMAWVGDYLYIWLKGEGRGEIAEGPALIYYDFNAKIYHLNPIPQLSTFHCKRHTSIKTSPLVSRGNLSINFY